MEKVIEWFEVKLPMNNNKHDVFMSWIHFTSLQDLHPKKLVSLVHFLMHCIVFKFFDKLQILYSAVNFFYDLIFVSILFGEFYFYLRWMALSSLLKCGYHIWRMFLYLWVKIKRVWLLQFFEDDSRFSTSFVQKNYM